MYPAEIGMNAQLHLRPPALHPERTDALAKGGCEGFIFRAELARAGHAP
jgi:hypothetical protein